MSKFRLPEPGELSNEAAIPMSERDMYWLLVVSAPVLVAAGESRGTDDLVNESLLAWWNGMNALSRPFRVAAQKVIREAVGVLPPAPWEDVDPQGNVIVTAHAVSWSELAAWAAAQDDAE